MQTLPKLMDAPGEALIPVVAGRLDAVERPVANQMIFPAHGVMQCMHARIAPVTVEAVPAQGRARAAQFKQAIARLD